MEQNQQNTSPKQNDVKTESKDYAGKTARSYINSPITPLFIIAGIFIGILGIIFTPRQEDPQISVPMVDIIVQYPGASNKQVEALVSEPLERLLKEIKGVDHVYSASARGMAVVTAQFIVGSDMENSLVGIYNKIASNLDKMPEDIPFPVIKPKGADDVPVVTFTLSSEELDSTQLRLLGYDVLQKVGSIPEAAQGFVVGGEPTEIAVEVSPEKLSGYDISLTQIGETIQSANTESVAGSFAAWQQNYRVYAGEYLKSAEDVGSLIVGVKDKAPVFLRDVATVTETHKEVTNLVNFYTGSGKTSGHQATDGHAAVTIALAKQPGANGVSVAKNAIEAVSELKGILIPENVHVHITRNYGQSANDKVNELIFKLFIATGSVTLLIWWFLGWRAAAVVSIVIPIVILSTVFSAWMMGLTIDRVSLFALIFSIGILVDDAVVVLENIYRRWLINQSTDTETTINAVSEVGNPTIIATLAVIAALMPMAFVSGMMGPYMAPIPQLGSVAMIISLFAAFAFTPYLAQRIKPSMKSLQEAENKEHEQSEKLGRFFDKLLTSLLVEKTKGFGLLIGIVVAFGLAVYLVYSTMVPVKLLPYDNKPDFSLVINFPEGTDLPITANLTHKMAKEIQELVPEVTTMESYVGTAAPFDFNGLVRHYFFRQSPWQADIQIHLLDKGERERSSHEIAEAVRAPLTEIARKAGARIEVVEMPPGPPVMQSIVAEVYGPDEQSRNEAVHKITAAFEKAEMVVDVDNYLTAPHDTWRFVIDKQKAMESGITVSTINQTIKMAMGGYKLGDVKQGFKRGEPTFIVIQAPQSIRAEFARIGQIPVQSQMGHMVPLNELGRFVIERQQTVLYHKDLKPVQYVTATGQGRLGAPIYGMLAIQEIIDNDESFNNLSGNFIFAPNGISEVGMKWAGEWTVTYKTFRDMGLAFGVALLIIYMLVVWEFKNFIIPLIVMAPIPLTIVGIAPGHWIMGAEFTATSMIGFIALAGIIVRNSILLVDFSRQEIEKGTPVTEAVIYACKARTRPIVITAAALVLGSSVILFDPIFQGMAISLIFGIFVATLLTLVVIPLGCVSARHAFCATNPDDMAGSSPICEPNGKEGKGHSGKVTLVKPISSIETSENASIKSVESPKNNSDQAPLDSEVSLSRASNESENKEVSNTQDSKNNNKEAKKDAEKDTSDEEVPKKTTRAAPKKAAPVKSEAEKATGDTTDSEEETISTAKPTRKRSTSSTSKTKKLATSATKVTTPRRKRGIKLKDIDDE